MLHDYDSRWAIDFQPFSKRLRSAAGLARFYQPLAAGQSVDIVDPNAAELNGYKLLVAPSLNVIDATFRRQIHRVC